MSPHGTKGRTRGAGPTTFLVASALAGGAALTWGLQGGAAGATAREHPPSAHHRVVSSPDAPAAIGPYSQGVSAGSQLYLSGQLPMDPRTGEILSSTDIGQQTRQVLQNLEAVLAADRMRLSNIVSTTVYLTDLDDFAAFNAAYAEFFPTAPPARATVQVARLPRDAKVEIAAIAVR